MNVGGAGGKTTEHNTSEEPHTEKKHKEGSPKRGSFLSKKEWEKCVLGSEPGNKTTEEQLHG